MSLACLALTACANGGGVFAPTRPAAALHTDVPAAARAARAARGTDVLTYKNDSSRSGANLTETVLTPANVTVSSFGLLRKLPVDGKVDAQPLYVSRLAVAGAIHDVVVAATERDTVYAFDAETGTLLWKTSLLGPGESPSDTHRCSQVKPEIGITATPVIDRKAGASGTVFVVAMSKDASASYHQRLHALDLATGIENSGSPAEISATYLAASGNGTRFDPAQYEERAALLLDRGRIYTSWTSHCDIPPYGGWIIAYDEKTLARSSVLNLAPNSGSGPSIWMSGGGPAADASGSIFLLTANGAFEATLDARGFPTGQDYGNSAVKLAAASETLSVRDYFTMFNELAESTADRDLGSGGELLLPDLEDSAGVPRHLLVGAGKDGNIYVLDRESLGRYHSDRNEIWQQLTGVLPGGIWSTPAYFNGLIYYGDVGGTLKAFAIHNARLVERPASQSSGAFGYPGTAPSVSANGNSDGIVWAHENRGTAVLHAYDATNLGKELYNSRQAPGGRDDFGAGNKYITPTIADGKVFVGTTDAVAVFGLLH